MPLLANFIFRNGRFFVSVKSHTLTALKSLYAKYECYNEDVVPLKFCKKYTYAHTTDKWEIERDLNRSYENSLHQRKTKKAKRQHKGATKNLNLKRSVGVITVIQLV